MLLSLFEFDDVIVTFLYNKDMEVRSCMLLTLKLKF